jgi:hypothetical protein
MKTIIFNLLLLSAFHPSYPDSALNKQEHDTKWNYGSITITWANMSHGDSMSVADTKMQECPEPDIFVAHGSPQRVGIFICHFQTH